MNFKYLSPAKRFIKKIKDKKLLKEIQNATDKILDNPSIGSPKTGDLNDVYCYDIFYAKTNYEVAYFIKDEIIFIMVGTRENFYDELKQYLK
jgi:hypothetical protein